MFFGPGQLVMFRKFCRDIKWWHLKRNICQSPFLNSTISMLIPYKIFQCICWLVIWILIPAASMTKIDPSLTETFACHHTFFLFYAKVIVDCIIAEEVLCWGAWSSICLWSLIFQTSQGWHLSVEAGLV